MSNNNIIENIKNNSSNYKKKNNTQKIILTENFEKIKELQKKYNEIKKEIFEIYTKQEIEVKNLKIRIIKKKTKIYNFYLKDYFISLLPILDSIESAICEFKKINFYKEKELYNYIYKIHSDLLYLFKYYQIDKIEKINIPFDPNMHQAMSLDFSKKYPKNFVSYIIQKGYHLKNSLLRPAIVSVST